MRLPCDAVLLLIDLQQAIRDPSPGLRDHSDVKAQIAALLAAWRAEGLPIVHVERNSSEPSSPHRPARENLSLPSETHPRQGEAILGRSADSAFIGTDLETLLDDFGATTLVVCGILGKPSLEASVRDGANLGYRLFVVADACWTTGEGEDFSLARIAEEKGEIVDCAMALRAAALANVRRRRR
jgi:nicotinamidase-related amidase